MITRMNTKQLLAASFIELAQSRPIEKISVADIALNCGMGRQTFYYHFATKNDLTRWIFSERTTAILDEWIAKEPWGKSLGRVLSMIASEKLFYSKAMKKRDSDVFFSYFYDYCVQYYLKQLKELHGIDPVDEELMFQIQFNCHGCTNMTREWLEHSSDESPEAIGVKLYEALPYRLKSYFSFGQ